MTVPAVRPGVAVSAFVALTLVASGCAAHKARKAENRSFLEAEELYVRGIQELAEDNLSKARDDLERIQFTAENLPLLEPLVKLRLADVTFYRGDDLSLIDARQKYLDFVTRHTEHPLAPYAQFQAGVCSLKQVGHHSKDQSQTHVALDDFREVLRRYPGTDYARAAQGVIDEANGYLARHEMMIGRFYYHRKAYPASIRRFRRVLDNYPHYEGREEVFLLLGQSLMLDGRVTEGRAYLDRVVQDSGGEYSAAAEEFLHRFETRSQKKAERQKNKKPKKGDAPAEDKTAGAGSAASISRGRTPRGQNNRVWVTAAISDSLG